MNLNSNLAIIFALVAGIGVIVALGWRAPDRSPGIEDKIDHDRIED